MAFEKINEFTNQIRDKYKSLDANSMNEPDETKRKRMYSEKWALFDALVIYYQTTLQTAKFRMQRDYCKQILTDLNPSWAKGYFSKTKKK